MRLYYAARAADILLALRIVAPALSLVVGVLIGLAIGRSRSVENPVRPAAPGAAVAPATCDPASPLQLRQLQQQSEEIRQLKEKLAAREKALRGAAPIDRKARAKEIFSLFEKAAKSQEGSDTLDGLAALGELDESMSGVFIERYRAGIAEVDLRYNTLMLILVAGGADAAAFVAERLSDPGMDPKERSAVMNQLNGDGAPMKRKLPYTPEIARLTEALLRSDEAFDRSGGVGLLGGSDSDEARLRLARLAESDPDETVRRVAMDSLGWNGDRSSLILLRTIKQRDPQAKNAWLERSIRQLERKYPD